MLGLLDAATSVLGQGGGLSGLTSGLMGSGGETSSSSTTVTQTFSTGAMGGDSTVVYLILAVLGLYLLTR